MAYNKKSIESKIMKFKIIDEHNKNYFFLNYGIFCVASIIEQG